MDLKKNDKNIPSKGKERSQSGKEKKGIRLGKRLKDVKKQRG